MKTARNKLPFKKALPNPETAALPVPNTAPEVDAGEDEDQLVRTSYAAHKLDVSENTIRLYAARGLLHRVQIGTRTVRITRTSLNRLMGQPE
jgi:hypothetical protein